MVDNESCTLLLKQLSKYDLLLEQLQKSMTDGFYNLGRANYHNKDSLRGRYGMDYWDKSYGGELAVNVDKEGSMSVIKRAAVSKEDIIGEKEADTEADDEGPRRRIKSGSREPRKPQAHVDPITMFGGSLSAPTSLRQCQKNFQGGIPLMIELINCKNDIIRLIKDSA